MIILKGVLNEPDPDIDRSKKLIKDIVLDCSKKSQKVAAQFDDLTKLLADFQQAFTRDCQKKKTFGDNIWCENEMIQSQTRKNLQATGDQAYFVNEQRRSRSTNDVDVCKELLGELLNLPPLESEGANLTQLWQVINEVLETLILEWKKMAQFFQDLTKFLETSFELKIKEFLGYVDIIHEEREKGQSSN